MYKFCPNCGFKNTEDKLNFTCLNCKRSFFTNSKPTSSIIPVFGDEILLGIRAREPAKGKYDIIGGFLENGEDPVIGGLRELREETGIDCKPEDLNYFGIWIGGDYVFEEETIFTLNIIYTLELDSKPEMKAADDLESLEWVPMEANPDLAFKFYTPLLKEIRKKYLH